jgi:hypothetical protein
MSELRKYRSSYAERQTYRETRARPVSVHLPVDDIAYVDAMAALAECSRSRIIQNLIDRHRRNAERRAK